METKDLRIILFLLISASQLGRTEHSYFAVTKIPRRWFSETSIHTELLTFDGTSFTPIVFACLARPWCRAFCKTGPKSYTFLSIISAAYNDDPNEVEKLDCYTTRNRFNILTAQANVDVSYATATDTRYGMKLENMLDGVEDFTLKGCFRSVKKTYPYVVFDLGQPKSVENMALIGPPESHTLYRFQELDIRVGNTPPSGSDFTSYQQLDYMSGKAPYSSYEFITNAAAPITGRYISVQLMKNAVLQLQICHVEIYT